MTLSILIALVFVPPVTWLQADSVEVERGVASLYRPWIKGPTVPYGRYAGRWSVKPTRRDLVCAHRTLPFGTTLKLTRKGKPPAFCRVLDRGPYGFCEKGRVVKCRRRGDPPSINLPRCRCPRGYGYIVTIHGKRKRGRYRGVIDATPAVHEMMESDGWEYVKVERLRLDRTLRVPRVKRTDGV